MPNFIKKSTMRKAGFNNADGFQDAAEAVNIDGFDNCCGMNADGVNESEYAFNANGEPDEDGIFNADGEMDEFVFNAEGEFVGAEGEFNADGEHFDADGDEYRFNANGEFVGDEGNFNASGEALDDFENIRGQGFSNIDGFDNARGRKQERQEKKASKQEIKKAKAAAKIERKQQKTAAQTARKAAKVERKNKKVEAKIERKAIAAKAAAAPIDLSTLTVSDQSVSNRRDEIEAEAPSNEMDIMNNEVSNEQEAVLEIPTDAGATQPEMVDEETGESNIDMEEVENFLNSNGIVEDDDNFLSAAGAERKKVRTATRAAKKLGKVQVKTDKGIAKADKKQAKADTKRVKADTKAVKADYKGQAKVIKAPDSAKKVEAISKAAASLGQSAAAALTKGAVSPGASLEDSAGQQIDEGQGASPTPSAPKKPGLNGKTIGIVLGFAALVGLGVFAVKKMNKAA